MTNLIGEIKQLQVMIDNGGVIVVDLESFSKFNAITFEEAKAVESLCTSMKVEQAMLKFIELSTGAFATGKNS